MKDNISWIDGKEVSIKKILEVQKKLGILFPQRYIEIVLRSNGARPKPCLFDSKNSGSGISALILIEDILKEKQYYDEAFHQDIPEDHEDLIRYKFLVPFAFDPGDSHLCFDYYQREEPAIIFLTDVYDIDFVADSFEEFLEVLYEPKEEEEL